MMTRRSLCLSGVFLIVLLACRVLTAADDPKPNDGDNVKLRGTWVLESLWFDGQEVPPGKTATMTFDGKKVILKKDVLESTGDYEIDPAKDPKTLDMTFEKDKRTIKAIYELRGNRLTVCLGVKDGPRPTEITANAGSATTLMRFERDK